MKRMSASVLTAVLMLVGSSVAQAQSPTEKLRRGAANVLLGVEEIPDQYLGCASQPEVMETANRIGLLRYPYCLTVGVIGAGLRELFGAAEVVTFPVPWPWREYRSPYESWWIADDYPWQ
ncbi:MAG: hypothetical protein HYZ92_02235 [Candidatus Omnitrophica bacterium]|nr:hypothetical protein [Candidatus Omnitrophota bacterium]